VPEQGQFEDTEVGKHVGGRFAQYDSEDEEEDRKKGQAESSQAAIARMAEAMVLGQMLVRKNARQKLEDGGYNRHTFNDKGLPEWFLDDERKYNNQTEYGVELPEQMVSQAREQLKMINSRTIKKVAEAKARKKRRMDRALTKVRKKANAVAEKSDLTEREKAKEVEKLYKKKITQKKESKKLIVGRRFQAGSGGKVGRNVKMVDSRLRSDSRGEKRAEKRKKAGGSAGGKGGGKGGKERKGRKQHKAKAYSRTNRK